MFIKNPNKKLMVVKTGGSITNKTIVKTGMCQLHIKMMTYFSPTTRPDNTSRYVPV